MTPPAIAVFEFDSIALGTHAADAMVKRAPIDIFRVGTVHPGKYVVLIGGSVAAVEESRSEGLRVGGHAIRTEIFLPDVHLQVYEAVGRKRRPNTGDALAILESASIPLTIAGADKAVKTAEITIVEIRLGDGLGGKGVTHLAGAVHDVNAAVEAALAAATALGGSICHTVIPIQHDDLRERINHATEFHS